MVKEFFLPDVCNYFAAGITDPGYNASCFVIRASHAVALREGG